MRPAPAGVAGAAPEFAPRQPAPGVQTEAFAFGGAADLEPAVEALAPAASGQAQAQPAAKADRLDALASRPTPEAAAPAAPGGKPAPGPKATAGFEQLKKAQAVA